jgi:competence protein ComEA
MHMLKKILALAVMLYASLSFAAVDVNKATAAELDGIKGIGPGISTKIIDERKKGNFKDWNDFVERVKGVGEGNAAKFSAEGMTVNGAGFTGAAAAPTAPVAKADAKPAAAAPAAAPAAKEEKKDPKAEAKMKAEEAKAKKEAAKQAKEDAKKAKADAVAPAATAAPAASTPKATASAAKK